MALRTVRFGAAVIVIASSTLVLVGCSGNSTGPTTTTSAAVNNTPPIPAPTPTPPPTTTVMAPPPQGVSAEVWRVAFLADGRLYRPQTDVPPTEAVHLDMSGFDQNVQNLFREMETVAADTVEQKTTFDLIPGGPGATFRVSLVPGLLCNGNPVVACTSFSGVGGRVTSGKIEFLSPLVMQDKPVVLHELLRTLGLLGNSPKSGIMSAIPWPQARPTDEERLMFRARYDYPLLAVFTDH